MPAGHGVFACAVKSAFMHNIKKDFSEIIVLCAGGLFIPHGISIREYNRQKSEFYHKLKLQDNINILRSGIYPICQPILKDFWLTPPYIAVN